MADQATGTAPGVVSGGSGTAPVVSAAGGPVNSSPAPAEFLYRSWAQQQLDMAHVLSGWYSCYNIFNIANFIDYEPFPKRRKVSAAASGANAAAVVTVSSASGYYHHYLQQHPSGAAPQAAAELDLPARKMPKSNNNNHQQPTSRNDIYRPFSINDHHHHHLQQQSRQQSHNGKSRHHANKRFASASAQQQQSLASADSTKGVSSSRVGDISIVADSSSGLVDDEVVVLSSSTALSLPKSSQASNKSDGIATDLSGISSLASRNGAAAGVTIQHIFPELLSMIFEKLDLQSKGRAAQVCSRWRESVYQKSVWRGCVARLHLRRSNPTLFPSLVRRGIKRVQVLSLRKSLRELVTGIPGLESLNLSGCYNLSDSALDTAFASRDLPALRHLDLSLCKEITDNSLGRIATHCKNLETLELGGCTRITNTGLLLIAWGLQRIRKLNLRSCWQISDQGIGQLTGALPMSVMSGGPSSAAAAHSLAVSGNRDVQQSGSSSSPSHHQSAVSSALLGAKTLEELSLQDCQKLTDESLRHIADGLPRLSRLNLSFCLSVTDTGLKSLSRIGSLRELNLRSCDNVSDIGIGFLGGGGGGSVGGGLSSGDQYLNSNNNSNCGLERLDVSFCDRVTDSAMAHVAAGLTQLVSLSLSACQISDAGVARIAEHLRGLEVLNIGQCARLTDRSVETIADLLGDSLRSLDLYGCTNITPGGLDQLRRCRHLKTVNRGLWHKF